MTDVVAPESVRGPAEAETVAVPFVAVREAPVAPVSVRGPARA